MTNKVPPTNEDVRRLLDECDRLGVPFSMITWTNERIIRENDSAVKKQEIAMMQDKAKWAGLVLTVGGMLVAMTMWATKASSAAESARYEITEVEKRVTQQIGVAQGIAQSASVLAHKEAETNGRQEVEIKSLQDSIQRIEKQNDKILDVLLRIEKKDR